MKKAMNWGKLASATSVFALATLALPGQALAQEAEVEGGLEDIVVTAQKRAQNVQDVPVAVSVTSAKDIERLQISSVESLQYSTPSLVVAGGNPTRKRFGIRGISGQVDHVFGNGGTLTSISALRTGNWSGSADEDFTPANIAATSLSSEDSSHVSQELRYASDTDGALDYLVGLYYLNQHIRGAGASFAFAPAINPLAPPVFLHTRQDAQVNSATYAAFLHANYRLTEQLQLTVGARLTRENKSINYRIADQSGLFTNGTLTSCARRPTWLSTMKA